ncbi:AlpA family phage regulatory protein [Stutzerimonas stutzeri]|uniref:helix-turn-helix transcriptional regulator n=1 Tax=Stutzerimonas stutzeri TaxID=316 RepID=UPI0015E29899|nr:AlpA family phage regulatory protein [Stutzerimonas stutzeri]
MAQKTSIEPTNEIRFCRLNEVKHIVGKSRSSIYLDIKLGKFPAPYELGSSRSVGWLSSEIDEWMKSRKRAHMRSPKLGRA